MLESRFKMFFAENPKGSTNSKLRLWHQVCKPKIQRMCMSKQNHISISFHAAASTQVKKKEVTLFFDKHVKSELPLRFTTKNIFACVKY